jgi:pyruvate dehydrogenase E2 component (dihydrolipoyllysine-residue acetyltransferase)
MPAGAVLAIGALLGGAAALAASHKKAVTPEGPPPPEELPPHGRPAATESRGAPTMDATLDDGTRAAVLRALSTENDAAKLEAFGEALLTIAPVAASLLLAKAHSMGGPATPHAPDKAPGGLDAGLDAGTSAAVLHALASETDPARLFAFAATLQLQYPIAAALLLAKSQELQRAHEQGQPPPVLVPPTVLTAPTTAPAPASPAPSAAPRTRPAPPPPPAPRAAPTTAPATPRAAPATPTTPRRPPPAPPGPRPSPGAAPAPHEAPVQPSACTFPLVDGASCIDAPRALGAAPTGFTTPKTWPPAMTKQAQNIFRSSATPAGVYYVYFTGDGGLYRFTKSSSNTVLASSHDVHVAGLAQPAAVAEPHHPAAPPPARPAPSSAPAPSYAPPTASAASCPFPLQAGVTCLDATSAMHMASGPFATPKTWPPVMTQQAVAANRSSATPPGVYYVSCATDGRVYKLTKSSSGNTTLQSAASSGATPTVQLQARA